MPASQSSAFETKKGAVDFTNAKWTIYYRTWCKDSARSKSCGAQNGSLTRVLEQTRRCAEESKIDVPAPEVSRCLSEVGS